MKAALCTAMLAVGAACNQTPPPNTTPDVVYAADTIRGVVRVVGSDPATWLTIQPPGLRAVSLSGAGVDSLRSVSGAEVWVRGRPVESYFEVSAFAVRAVDGRPVYDGVLRQTGSGFWLALSGGGSVELRDPPQAVRALSGARIWITQSVEGRGDSYGVITDR